MDRLEETEDVLVGGLRLRLGNQSVVFGNETSRAANSHDVDS